MFVEKYVLILLLLTSSLFSYDVTDDFSVRSFATINVESQTDKENDTSEESLDYSIAGAQVDWDVTESFNVMLQGIYSKRGRDATEYTASLEWAMLGYKFGDGYQIRAGQFKVPFMSASSTQYIGYSRLWTKPILLPNGTNGFEKMHGVEFVGNNYIGDVDIEYQLSAGQAEHIAYDTNEWIYNVVAKASYANSWLRASYGQLSFEHIDPDKPPLANPKGILTYTSLETKINYKAIDFYGGYAFNKNDVIPDDELAYIGLSYRIGKFIPYALYKWQNRSGTPYGSPPPAGGPPPGGGGPPPPPPPRPTLDGYEIKEDHILGLRYNLHPSIILKLEYNRQIDLKHKFTSGDEKRELDVFTFAVDMVF